MECYEKIFYDLRASLEIHFFTLKSRFSSFPRMRESSTHKASWILALARMTISLISKDALKPSLRFTFYTYNTMSAFSTAICPVLNRYKTILRKNLPLEEANSKIKQLRLNRKQIRNADDVSLYNVASNTIKDIEKNNKDSEWSFAKANLSQQLKSILDEYQIENNKIINPKHQASRAIINIIQTIKFSPIDNFAEEKMEDFISLVAKYGTPEQQNTLRYLFKQQSSIGDITSDIFLQKFNNHLVKFSNI